MNSRTPTLLDPFEVAAPAPRASMGSLTPELEWFDRSSLVFVSGTPEPIDRRWRARGWCEE
jgi:hypothetical protein